MIKIYTIEGGQKKIYSQRVPTLKKYLTEKKQTLTKFIFPFYLSVFVTFYRKAELIIKFLKRVDAW